MKKIILIIMVLFFITGCYDFKELDELAIINTIAIDYIDNEYYVTLEIIDDSKSSDSKESSEEKVYYIDAKAKRLSDAFYILETKITREPFYAHVELLVISNQILEHKFDEVADYILRSPKISSTVNLIVSKKELASELINHQTKSTKIASKIIKGLIENDLNNNAAKDLYFHDIVSDYLSYGIDAYLPCASFIENTFIFDELAILNGKKIATYIDSEDIKSFNILNNNIKNINVHTDNTSVRMYNGETKISIEDKINIKVNLMASLIEYNSETQLANKEKLEELNKKYEEIMKKKLTNFYNTIKHYESDILGINERYYKKEKEKKDVFKQLPIELEVIVTIEKIGLTFEVKNDS